MNTFLLQKGKTCTEDNKTHYDEERWLKDKCTECICLVRI